MTGAESSSETSNEGFFTIPGVMPGTYTLQVDSLGFATTQAQNIVLHVGDNKSLLIRMSVGSADQSVTVDGGALTVNVTDAVVNTVIQQKYLENLPLNGRTAAALLQLAPGTVDLARNVNPIGTQRGVYPGEATASVNGSTRTQINYQLDGVTITIRTSMPACRSLILTRSRSSPCRPRTSARSTAMQQEAS
jgi:hypothetical protein